MVAYPAIHPDVSARTTYELGWMWHTKMKVEFGNPLIVMPESFEDKLLTKMGLDPIGGKVFRIMD
jgi:hypothetical protein